MQHSDGKMCKCSYCASIEPRVARLKVNTAFQSNRKFIMMKQKWHATLSNVLQINHSIHIQHRDTETVCELGNIVTYIVQNFPRSFLGSRAQRLMKNWCALSWNNVLTFSLLCSNPNTKFLNWSELKKEILILCLSHKMYVDLI